MKLLVNKKKRKNVDQGKIDDSTILLPEFIPAPRDKRKGITGFVQCLANLNITNSRSQRTNSLVPVAELEHFADETKGSIGPKCPKGTGPYSGFCIINREQEHFYFPLGGMLVYCRATPQN